MTVLYITLNSSSKLLLGFGGIIQDKPDDQLPVGLIHG